MRARNQSVTHTRKNQLDKSEFEQKFSAIVVMTDYSSVEMQIHCASPAHAHTLLIRNPNHGVRKRSSVTSVSSAGGGVCSSLGSDTCGRVTVRVLPGDNSCNNLAQQNYWEQNVDRTPHQKQAKINIFRPLHRFYSASSSAAPAAVTCPSAARKPARVCCTCPPGRMSTASLGLRQLDSA